MDTKKNIKDRVVKNWITTIIGTMFMLAALGMLVINRLDLLENTKFSILEMGIVALLGWLFLMSKNSILNGLSIGLFSKIGWIKEE